MRSRTPLLAAVADAACILTFAAVGRASHGEPNALIGVLHVGWPFLAGCALVWIAAKAWRDPLLLWPQGVQVWALTWAMGMVFRHATGAGTAPSFMVVAAVVLGVLLLGWRGVATWVTRRAAASRQSSPSPQAAPR